MFNNKIASKNSSLKKYCKVCHDAGKSETEYTSHFIRENRDPLSKVVCPTLLSLDCRYCSKKGHTVKYCKILEKDKIAEARQSKSITNTKTKPKSEEKYKQPNNMFSNLESDSEDEEVEVKEVIEMPKYDGKVAAQEADPENIELDADVDLEAIADRYQLSGGLIKNCMLLAMTRFACAPYGELGVANWVHNFTVSASHRLVTI